MFIYYYYHHHAFAITFILGLYNYITETTHVSRVCNVAPILWLPYLVQVMLFPVINVLYFFISMFDLRV
jgi:hypothetical protein